MPFRHKCNKITDPRSIPDLLTGGCCSPLFVVVSAPAPSLQPVSLPESLSRSAFVHVPAPASWTESVPVRVSTLRP